MEVKVLPRKDEVLNCLEDDLVSVVLQWEHRFEVMFAESWGFKFEVPNNYTGLIGNLISENRGDRLKLLEDFHGINTQWIDDLSNNEKFEEIRSETQKGRPVLIALDAYWCHWMSSYKYVHSKYHFVLALGVRDNEIICNDSTHNKEEIVLPINEYLEGAGPIVKIKEIGPDKKDIDWKELLKKSLSRLCDENKKQNSFQQMRDLADYIEQKLDVKKEIKNIDMVQYEPIVNKIYDISMYRKQFAVLLSYISKIIKEPELEDVSEEMVRVGEIWNIVNTLLVKAWYMSNIEKSRKKIADKIRVISELEESLYNKISLLIK